MQVETVLTQPRIVCPLCGLLFDPSLTASTLCPACLTASADLTLGVTKEGYVHFCRFCHRYLRPPWIKCDRESKELLALCLRKVRGLNAQGLRIKDAGFVWTEPHSKRLKIRITVQKDHGKGSLLEQTFVAEFVETFSQCDDCKKEFTPHVWGALVQVRQRASHKKTFFYIEQLILKHNAHDKVLKVEEAEDGIDFFYKTATHANRLIDFLGELLPLQVKQSKQLISHDAHSNLYNYKYVYSVEIPGVCRDDLVLIPRKLATVLGGVSQVLLCHKVASAIHLVDPRTLKLVHLNSIQYFHYEKDIRLISIREAGTLFQIVDNEREGPRSQNLSFTSYSNRLIDKITRVTAMRLTDYSLHELKTHLTLTAGCDVLAYDLPSLGVDQADPQIIIAKKVVQKKNAKRRFKLKRLQDQGVMIEEGRRRKKPKQAEKEEQEFQEFMDDLERDPEQRKNVNLYRKGGAEDEAEEDEDEDGVKIAELLMDLKIDVAPQDPPGGEDEDFVKKLQSVGV